MRAVPVMTRELAAGRSALASARMIAAWIAFTTRSVTPAERGREHTLELVRSLDVGLAEHPHAVDTVHGEVAQFYPPSPERTP